MKPILAICVVIVLGGLCTEAFHYVMNHFVMVTAAGVPLSEFQANSDKGIELGIVIRQRLRESATEDKPFPMKWVVGGVKE